MNNILRFPIERALPPSDPPQPSGNRAFLIQRINEYLFGLQPGFDAFPASFRDDFDAGVDIIAIERNTPSLQHWKMQLESVELAIPGRVFIPTRSTSRLPQPSRIFNSKADILLLHLQESDRVFWFKSAIVVPLLCEWGVRYGYCQSDRFFGVSVPMGELIGSAWRSDFLDPVQQSKNAVLKTLR